MGQSFYPQLRDLLLAHGCYFVRQGKGSHEIWCNPANEISFPVPASIVSRHTANGILKQAGIIGKI